MKKSKVYLVSDEQFKEIVANANSYSDCLRALNLTTKGGSSTDILKKRISELKCSTEHFKKQGRCQQQKSGPFQRGLPVQADGSSGPEGGLPG